MRKRKVAPLVPVVAATPPQLLSIPEVARLLSVGRTKVYDLIRKEGLPAVQVGSAMRISLADLHTWIQEHKRQAS
jgi:excisionase family DNA binding protein